MNKLIKLESRTSSILLFVAILFLQVSVIYPQNSTTLDSYRKALGVLEESILASGGKDAVNNISNISYDMNGIAHARNQSPTSNFPSEQRKAEVKVVLEVKNDRAYLADKVTQLDGLIFEFLFVAGREPGFNVIVTRNHYNLLPANSPMAGTVYRFVPAVILAKAFEQRATLRWLGQHDFKGKKHDLIAFFWNGVQYTLYLDSVTKLVSRLGFMGADNAIGDVEIQFTYSDYKKVDNLTLPFKVLTSRNEEPIREVNYSNYQINTRIDESFFKLPERYKTIQFPRFGFKKMGEGVYLIEGFDGGTTSAMAVEFKDHFAVIDAPGGSAGSVQVINELKKIAPNKPIKYLILTHHHDDHSGGIRPYVAIDTKLVTVSANRSFFEKIASSTFSLAPDALTSSIKKPDFMFVEKKKVFADETQTFEIHKIKTGHSENIYLAYFPKQKILFQADLYNWANAPTVHTATMFEAIEKLGLQVENLVGAHGGVFPFATVKKEVDELKPKK
jgi:glyoxylase-like metal-dependent hydrolase (beta-lactamase superfamily II)